MMRTLALALFALVSIAACSQPASVEVKDVWTRATIGGTKQAAVFMIITSPAGDRLVRASTTVAERTDLMTMETRDGQMSMSYVDGIDVPANQPVSLDPSGLHVWLAGVERPLTAGETFPLELTFEKAGDVRVDVHVVAPTAAPPHASMGM